MTESSLSESSKSISLDDFTKDATVALSIQVSSLILTYLVQVCLARWMGKTEYGIYEYVMALTLLLTILSGLGLPRTAMRFISVYRVEQDWGRLRGILRGSWLLTLLGSVLLSGIVVGIVLWVGHYRDFVYATPLLVGIGLLPLQALMNLYVETTTALEDIPLAYIPSELIWPLLLLGSGFFLLHQNDSLSSIQMLIVAMLTLLVVLVFQAGLVQRKVHVEVESAAPVYNYNEWIKVSLILLVQQAFLLILEQSDVLLVGTLLGPGETGIYNAAVMTAHWVGLVLIILNTISSPRFAALYAQKDMQGLQQLVAIANIWIFLPTIVIALGLFVFAQPVLSLFGSDFVSASLALKFLVLSRLVNALCGSVSALMVMTGHQNKSLPVFGYCLVINLILHMIAIPRLGIVGAAIATCTTTIIWNIWLSFLVVKYVGIQPSIFSLLHYKKNVETE